VMIWTGVNTGGVALGTIASLWPSSALFSCRRASILSRRVVSTFVFAENCVSAFKCGVVFATCALSDDRISLIRVIRLDKFVGATTVEIFVPAGVWYTSESTCVL